MTTRKITLPNGNAEYRNEFGELHREDGPALHNPKTGAAEYRINGQLHSLNDEPATLFQGGKFWYKHGQLHRDEDKPAVEYPSGYKEWHKNGKSHRDEDKPAVVYPSGTKMWYKQGKLHRDNDKPAKIESDGSKSYWKNGKEYIPEHPKD